MDTKTLTAILKETIIRYAKPAFNGYTFLTSNPDETRFVITGIGHIQKIRIVNAAIVVQIVENIVVIEQDINDKPLVDDLLDAGVPRSQIVLAYIGETMPELAR